MDGCMDGWMGGWIDGWIDGWNCRRMDVWTHGWMVGEMGEWESYKYLQHPINQCSKQWMDVWMVSVVLVNYN